MDENEKWIDWPVAELEKVEELLHELKEEQGDNLKWIVNL